MDEDAAVEPTLELPFSFPLGAFPAHQVSNASPIHHITSYPIHEVDDSLNQPLYSVHFQILSSCPADPA